MRNVCFLKIDNKGELKFDSQTDLTGKLTPKSGNTFNVLIKTDNPDITSLVTEKRLTEQAAFELEKQIGYNIKIWSTLDNYPINQIDITISFKDQDPYFTDNVLGYAGFPNGSFKGIVVFNNKFVWLDGKNKTGKQLRELGLALPGMIDIGSYMTYNYKQTVKHEAFGHAFGLPHTEDNEDVMNPYYAEYRIMYGILSKNSLNTKYGKASFRKRMLPDDYIRRVMSRTL
jgi:hypothetical protein